MKPESWVRLVPVLLCVSASHHHTPLDTLARMHERAGGVAADLIAAHESVRGAVVVATCNRFEIYADVDDEAQVTADRARDAVLTTLQDRLDDEVHVLHRTAAIHVGDDVVHHLFSVSVGLESMVIGEEEISGQVQRALATARVQGTASPRLEQLFQRASKAARHARSRTDLVAAGRSLARVALDMVESRIVDFQDVPVLVVGTGSYAATTIAHLRARGADRIHVYSATGRAAQFAAKYGIVPESDLRDAIAGARVVITCTSRYTVGVDDLTDALPRMVVDLGLPRNVDPAVGDLPGIDLIDLELIGRHSQLPDLSGAGVRAAISSEAQAFAAEQRATPAVVAVRSHIDGLLQRELDRQRSLGTLDPAVESALRHFTGMLTHAPSERARAAAAQGEIDAFEQAITRLFGVQVEQPARHLRDAAS